MFYKIKSLIIKLFSIYKVKRSKYFDKSWYINNYSDLGVVYKFFPAVHYSLFGWREGRNPSNLFNSNYYLDTYQDVRDANLNPLYHYERIGRNESRNINNARNEAMHIYNLINSSLCFNIDWYVKNYRLYSSGPAANPIADFMSSNGLKNPGPIFNSKEYYYLNPDVAIHNINPLMHYLNNGIYENRHIALTELKEYKMPEGTVNIEKNFFNRKNNNQKIVTVLACFSASCKIEDFQIYLLKGLQKISDYIIIVSDNPVYEEDLTKINKICNHCIFTRHGEYDFGSYKRGFNYLIDNNILQADDNLLFINDSNYGPVYPFEYVINDFRSKECDFYGLTYGNNYYLEFLQSFFYIFKPNVYNSNIFKNFINSVKKQLAQAWVALEYEYAFTNMLEQENFVCTSYIPNTFMKDKNNAIPTKYGYTLMSEYKYPLVKRKVISGSTVENVDDILNYIKLNNTELYEIIIKRENLGCYKKEKYVDIPSKYLLLSNYAKKEQVLKEKINKGEKINVIFFVYSIDTFIAEQVMQQMMKDSIYNVQCYIIPDLRMDEHLAAYKYMDIYEEMRNKYSIVHTVADIDEKLIELELDSWDEHDEYVKNTNREYRFIDEKKYIVEKCFTNFKNVIKGCDIVFYPHLQDISFSLYNPFYAVRLNILSVYIPHEIYLFKYDRNFYKMDNFNNFWKVFLDSQISYDEYKQYGQCKAVNAEVTGLNSEFFGHEIKGHANKKKKMVIAPYFSIHNSRKMLNTYALENFRKELFELPEQYTDVEFVYLFSDAFNNILLNTNDTNIQEILDYIDKIKDYENVIIHDEKDYRKVLSSSDAVILDSGTLFIDTVLLNIPCVYIVKNKELEKKKFNEIGYYMFDVLYKAENTEEIYSFINEVIISNQDKLKDKRNRILNDIKLEYKLSSNIIGYLNKLLCD